MHRFGNLNAEDRAKVDNKLAELHDKTRQCWDYEITQQPQANSQYSLLEVSVDGRIAKPITLEDNGANPADKICSELDRLLEHRSGC